MPWSVKRRGSRYAVVKKSGEVVAMHATREKALAHLRALYANTGDEARGGKK